MPTNLATVHRLPVDRCSHVFPSSRYDVPRAGWRQFLGRFVARQRGALTVIEQTDERSGDAARRSRPLEFHDARLVRRVDGGEELVIIAGDPPYLLETFTIIAPEQIGIVSTERAAFTLEVRSA